MGLGYGDEDEFRARLACASAISLGGGRMLDLDAKYSSLEYRVEGTFTNPLILSTNNDLFIQSGFIRRYLPGFTDKAIFTQVRLERDLPWRFRGYVGHGLEFTRPFNIPEETLAPPEPNPAGKLYRSSMALLGLRQETIDNAIDPHRGGLAFAGPGNGPGFSRLQMQFVRTRGWKSGATRAWGTRTSSWRAASSSGSSSPFRPPRRFPFSGAFSPAAINSVRGYRLDYLGPRNAQRQSHGGERCWRAAWRPASPYIRNSGPWPSWISAMSFSRWGHGRGPIEVFFGFRPALPYLNRPPGGGHRLSPEPHRSQQGPLPLPFHHRPGVLREEASGKRSAVSFQLSAKDRKGPSTFSSWLLTANN